MMTLVRELATLDRVIHEPARLAIMTVLYVNGEADFLYLQRQSGLTKGNLSNHLARLEREGYVKIEKTFKGKYPLTICRLTRSGCTALKAYVKRISVVGDAIG